MPNLKASIKQVRKARNQTLRNKIRKSKYRSLMRGINILIKDNKKKESLKLLSQFNSQIAKSAKLSVISKKTASRLVSRVTKKINLIKK